MEKPPTKIDMEHHPLVCRGGWRAWGVVTAPTSRQEKHDGLPRIPICLLSTSILSHTYFINVYICIYMYIYIYMCIYIYMYIYMYICMYMRTHIYIYTYLYIHMGHVHIYIYVYIYTHIYTHVHTLYLLCCTYIYSVLSLVTHTHG